MNGEDEERNARGATPSHFRFQRCARARVNRWEPQGPKRRAKGKLRRPRTKCEALSKCAPRISVLVLAFRPSLRTLLDNCRRGCDPPTPSADSTSPWLSIRSAAVRAATRRASGCLRMRRPGSGAQRSTGMRRVGWSCSPASPMLGNRSAPSRSATRRCRLNSPKRPCASGSCEPRASVRSPRGHPPCGNTRVRRSEMSR